MKKIVVLAALLLPCVSPVSSAEVFRCKGTVKWGEQITAVRLDVVLPEEKDLLLSLTTHEGELIEIVDIFSAVGSGAYSGAS